MSQIKSAFCGLIKEIPFISVDNFEHYKRAYFLTHFHTDHVVGLDRSDFKLNLENLNAFIYSSAVTAAIIKDRYSYLSPFLKILELGRNTVMVTINDVEHYLEVTTLPAGHCLGSVMFLFHYNTSILYTGDFRLSENTIQRYTHLHKNGEQIKIDVLYLDTTFQTEWYYPRRSEVIRNIIVYIKEWLATDEQNQVMIKTSARYGYESICNEVFKTLGIKTYIEDDWNVYKQFPNEIYGITDDPSSRIHLYTKYKKNVTLEKKHLSIYLSAQKWMTKNKDERFINVIKKNRIEACFSSHCSRSELIHFVNYLNPNKIVGFPNKFDKVLNCDQNVDGFILDSTLVRDQQKSDSVTTIGNKLSKESIKNLFEW